MIAETLPITTKTFKFSFPTCTNEDVLFHLEVPVEIPLEGSTRELVQRVINMFHIPVYLEDELNEKLALFVLEETRSFHNARDKRLLDQLKVNDIDVDALVKQWEKLFKETVVEFSEDRGTPDCEVLAAAHQRLAQTPAFQTMLQSETAYARAMHALIKERDKTLHQMAHRQSVEMDSMVRSLDTSSTEHEINALAGAQWAACGSERARWESKRDALMHAQRAQHMQWMMHALAEQVAQLPGESPLASYPSPPALLCPGPPASSGSPPAAPGSPRLEESFTIHLGSQLKLTHNIRIAAIDLLDLARLNPDNSAEWSRRMQTSLSLYSSDLSCVVLLSESLPSRMAGHSEVLVEIAHQSTDHHFEDVEDQLRVIAEQIKQPVEARNRQRLERANSNPPPPGSKPRGGTRGSGMRAGDVFVTRHSNLADVTVVFHLIVDDSLRSGDISSRHPVILGLRSILRACAAHDVTSIALPLLLAHHLTEEMTMSWCLRRAELVLKCVKGFALETAGGGGADIRTLTIALPSDTDSAVFHSLAALTPNIFRLSNPVKVKPSPT